MNVRRVAVVIAGAALLLILLAAAFSYRYLLLSKLNIPSTGGNEAAIGLRQIAEIPLPGGANRFDYQSIDDQDRLLFIAHLGSDQVIVFDLNQENVAATIPDIASPHGVTALPDMKRLYVAATGTHQVAIVDMKTDQIIARADGGTYPDGLAYDPETHKLFVSDESGGRVIVIDTRTNQRTNRIDLGGEAGNTVYDEKGHQIVSAAQGRNQLALIDPMHEQVTAMINLPGCDGPHGFSIVSATRTAYVSCEGNAMLFAVNLDTRQITASEPVGDIPDVLAYDPGLQRLYVASESGVVAVFQLSGASMKKIGQAYLAPNAHTIAVDPQTHRVYLPLENIHGHPVLWILEPKT